MRTRVTQDQLQLREILDHRNDRATQLGGQDHCLDVAGILEAVTDDQAVPGRLRDRHHGKQFGLGSDLQAETELATVGVHLVDDQPLLVDLDGEYGRIAVAIVVLGDGARERVVQVPEPVRKDS